MDKCIFVKEHLKPMLMTINPDIIEDVVYIEIPASEYVVVICDGYDISVNITGDSFMAILKDVSTKLLKKL